LYEQWFEERCLSETGAFYRQEARKLLDEYNCSEYMERVRLYVVCRLCPCVVCYFNHLKGTGVNWLHFAIQV